MVKGVMKGQRWSNSFYKLLWRSSYLFGGNPFNKLSQGKEKLVNFYFRES